VDVGAKALIIYNNNVYLDSRKVAPLIGLEHPDLLEGINHMVDILANNGQDVSEKFIPYMRGGRVLWYRLSRSGCDMVAMALTSDETTRLLFINAYTDRFRRGEKKLARLLSEDWQRKRKQNISGQISFHDTIKELVTYAEQMGSKNAGFYYTDYNRLLNRTVGLNDGERDEATSMQLDKLNQANTYAGEIIKKGIADGDDYHDIYKTVKQELTTLKKFWDMTLPSLPQEVEG
jgi:phage regulator Rha-like protein